MAKPNFKPQRPARKVKLKANPQKRQKVNKKVAVKKKSSTKIKTKPKPWQLPPDYFDNLPPTHNAFIGESQSDTLENVITGIALIESFAVLKAEATDPSIHTGLYWLSQNLIQALRFELKHSRLPP